MKIKILAGNWKMHTDLKEGVRLAASIGKHVNSSTADPHVRIILGVPATHLSEIAQKVDYRRISVSAQNCASQESGAYTGEVSAAMIKSTGAHYCIIGHSERRQIFGETYEVLKQKVDLALKNALRPIFCCGETLEVREKDQHKELIKEQLQASLFHLSADDILKSVIAYEPIWAIGTGKTASPDQAQDMHAHIRQLIKEQYPDIDPAEVPILYGGSVKPENATELFKQEDINGGLVGGASLKLESFMDILNAF